MTAYNIVNPSHLVAGQPQDVGDVLANYQALQTVLNGNIDGANLKNYPADAAKVLYGDMSWKVPVTIGYLGGQSIAGANTDLAAPNQNLVTLGITTAGGSVRSIGAPGTSFGSLIRLINYGGQPLTFLHATAGGSGAMLSLRDGYSLTIFAGESVTFFYDGGNWTEIVRDVRSELLYVQATANVVVTTNTVLIPATAVTVDVAPLFVDFYCQGLYYGGGGTDPQAYTFLYIDGAAAGLLANTRFSSSYETGMMQTQRCGKRVTGLSAGSHTFAIYGSCGSGASFTWQAGDGAGGNSVPMFMRIIKAF